ncbi:MAG TPA: serine/threonine-protein kinase [Planctomycetota bacterium]|nr:serine/threonine-protein kinase [Planctomycetota bacterium]
MSDALDRDSEFARRAVERRLLSRTDIQEALKLQDRYRSAGVEVPSLPRILVNTNKIPKDTATDLLRAIHEDSRGRIPGPSARMGAVTSGTGRVPSGGQASVTRVGPDGQPIPPGFSAPPPQSVPPIPGHVVPQISPPRRDTPQLGIPPANLSHQGGPGAPPPPNHPMAPAAPPPNRPPAPRVAQIEPYKQDKSDPSGMFGANQASGEMTRQMTPPSGILNPNQHASTGSFDPSSAEAKLAGLGATVLRTQIAGYKILEVIGEGSMGIVYRAKQLSMDRIVALKILSPEKCRDNNLVQQFLREAQAIGRLNHPNVIRVHEVSRSGDAYYYSMEYVDGVVIGDILDDLPGGFMDWRRAFAIGVQVLQALEHGLSNNIIHREIRPDSIMISEGDTAKLADLGLVRDEQSRFLEGENSHYVAPEQVRGERADSRTDIYCLGCVLFLAVTGEPPFSGSSPREVLNKRLATNVPDAVEINAEISRRCGDIIKKMMAKDRRERYQRPAEVIADMERALVEQDKPKPRLASSGPKGTIRSRGRLGRGGGMRRGRSTRFRRRR